MLMSFAWETELSVYLSGEKFHNRNGGLIVLIYLNDKVYIIIDRR